LYTPGATKEAQLDSWPWTGNVTFTSTRRPLTRAKPLGGIYMSQ
jgi:hypothetical protein